jgi:hypothetical protein
MTQKLKLLKASKLLNGFKARIQFESKIANQFSPISPVRFNPSHSKSDQATRNPTHLCALFFFFKKIDFRTPFVHAPERLGGRSPLTHRPRVPRDVFHVGVGLAPPRNYWRGGQAKRRTYQGGCGCWSADDVALGRARGVKLASGVSRKILARRYACISREI